MKRKDERSIIGPTAWLRIQAATAGARGVVRGPQNQDEQAEEDQEPRRAANGKRIVSLRNYGKSLINATPPKPKLVVIMVRTGTKHTQITVGVADAKGRLNRTMFTTKAILTERNAEETGRDIARELGDVGAAAMAGVTLRELAAAPRGASATFTISSNNQLSITSGGE